MKHLPDVASMWGCSSTWTSESVCKPLCGQAPHERSINWNAWNCCAGNRVVQLERRIFGIRNFRYLDLPSRIYLHTTSFRSSIFNAAPWASRAAFIGHITGFCSAQVQLTALSNIYWQRWWMLLQGKWITIPRIPHINIARTFFSAECQNLCMIPKAVA